MPESCQVVSCDPTGVVCRIWIIHKDIRPQSGHLPSSLLLLRKKKSQAAEEANWNKWHWLQAKVKASKVINQQCGSQRNHRGRLWTTAHHIGETASHEGYWWGDSSTGFVIFTLQIDGWCTPAPCKTAVATLQLWLSFKPEALSSTEAWHHELACHACPGWKSCYHLPTVQGKNPHTPLFHSVLSL